MTVKNAHSIGYVERYLLLNSKKTGCLLFDNYKVLFLEGACSRL